MAECVAQMRPLIVAVAYAPTNQSSAEDREQFYSDLDRVLTRTSGLTMVKGELNVTLVEHVQGVVQCSLQYLQSKGCLDNHFALY